jgi:hypothetical protein
MFIMSLAAADITVGGIVMPISSVYAITGKKIYRWMYQTSHFHICHFGHRWCNYHFNACEARRLIFSGITDNISYNYTFKHFCLFNRLYNFVFKP